MNVLVQDIRAQQWPGSTANHPSQPFPPLPEGWELLYDPSGRVYFGCPSMRHVQWKFPLEHVQAAAAYQQPLAAQKPSSIAPPQRTNVQVQRDIEEVDAMDSQGYWYQAFIVKQDEEEALVHFSGWGVEFAEKIKLSEFPKRIRARSSTTATGQAPIPSKEDVRRWFGVPPPKLALTDKLPVGWEVLYDASGKMYYGNRELKRVQWEHPSQGASSSKQRLAAQYAFMGAVHTIMSFKMRGKQIVPTSHTSEPSSGEENNNIIQKLKMWGTLVSDLFKVVMACLLAVFVPQNCPPSTRFDKEVGLPLQFIFCPSLVE
jgi:hypothetical protein